MSAPAAQMPAALPPRARVHSVWEVCQRVKDVIASDDLLPDVWVRGEVSNARRTPGGHLSFTLKDKDAQLNGIMWRSAADRLPFEVKDGLGVIVHGRVSLFDGRGVVQLYADEVHPDGYGQLHLAYEQLKERLTAQGLFDPARKRPLPSFPRRIGVVTSLHGAALRDVLRILDARFPLSEVVVKPVRVQGDGAGFEVAAAINLFNRHHAADVLIVGRGGGSIEDLWCFNEEVVARAIFDSHIPVVSAVGHETDFTIADFVADLRAPTPTAAAEAVVPDGEDLHQRLALHERALQARAARLLDHTEHRVASLEGRAALRRPDKLLRDWTQRLEEAQGRLEDAAAEAVRTRDERLARATSLLDSYSPLRTLQRGYALASVDGKPVTRTAQLPPGTTVMLQVADGSVKAVVADG